MLTEEQVAKLAAEVAIDVYEKKMEKHNEKMRENLHENTKKLLGSYKELKTHVDEAIVSTEDAMPGDLRQVLLEVFDNNGFIKVQAIAASKQRTALMISHTDAMLAAYRDQCEVADKPYFRILFRFYVEKESMNDIIEDEHIGRTSGWDGLKRGVEDMSILLWGLTGLA